MRKAILVHVDALTGDRYEPSKSEIRRAAEEKVRSNIGRVLGEAWGTVETITEGETPRMDASVYIVPDSMSAEEALGCIQQGDEVEVVGLYRDVAIAMILREAPEKGATAFVPEGGSFDQSLGLED